MTDRSRPGAALILAAGEGTRMRSAVPKVLHPIGGRSLLGHAVHAVAELDPEQLVVVLGPRRRPGPGGRHRARRRAGPPGHRRRAGAAAGHRPRGAVRARRAAAAASPAPCSSPTATCRCCPPTRSPRCMAEHTASGAAVTLVTTELADPTGYGRVVRETDGTVTRIVEQADATAEERAIREVNSGVYAFDGAFLDRRARAALDDEQPGRALPHRPHQDRARRRRRGARRDLPRRVAGARRQRPRPARRAGRRAQPQAAGAVDALRRHGGRSPHDLGGRPGAAGARRRAAPGHAAARRHDGRRRRGDRAGHHAHRRRGRARRPRGAHPRQRLGDRRGRVRRPVRLPAPGRAARRARQDRHVRRGQERRDRRGLEGAAPHLRRRRDDRRALQHRRQLDVRQLRRHPQAPHGDRLARAHRLGHEVHRAALRRRRGLHRGGRRAEAGRAAGRAGRLRWAPTHHRRLGGEEPSRHTRRRGRTGPPPRG